MSAESIIDTMKALISVHQTFNEHAGRKTESVKNGNIHRLEQLMNEEEALVSKLKELEETRIRQVNEFFSQKGILIDGDVTITKLLRYVSLSEQEQLRQLQQELMKEIEQLKQQNALNQELIRQSLDFVNLSLQLFQPDPEPVTYDHPNQTGSQQRKGKSLFDSKA